MKTKLIISEKLFSDIVSEKIKPIQYNSPLLNKVMLDFEYNSTIHSFILTVGDKEDYSLLGENKYSDDEICQFLNQLFGKDKK